MKENVEDIGPTDVAEGPRGVVWIQCQGSIFCVPLYAEPTWVMRRSDGGLLPAYKEAPHCYCHSGCYILLILRMHQSVVWVQKGGDSLFCQGGRHHSISFVKTIEINESLKGSLVN